VGQAALDREVAIDSVGIAGADKFFPKNSNFRTTADTQIAILQNYAIINGQQVPVLSSDKHMAHAREHLKPLLDAYQATAAGEMEEMEFALTFGDLFAHTVEHVSAVEGDPSAIEEAAAMRQMLQQVEEFINNGYKAAEAAEQEAAANPEVAEGAPQEGPSVEQAERFAEAQAKIRIMEAGAEVARQIKIDNAAVDRSIKDANAAAEIRRKNMAFTATPPKPAAKKAKAAKKK
jgi:pyruvate/2-oxoglutarate dehydrogenase complex dihydrolipoamide acyltransferase (E2) component